MSAIDGGLNDHDGTSNGRVVVSIVPFGAYNVTMTGIPAGYNVLGNSTQFTVDNTRANGTITFRIVHTNTDLTTLAKTVITDAPDLTSSTLSNWTSTFNALKVNVTSSHINSVASLPPILSVGINNSSETKSAISSQASIVLSKSFTPNTSGSVVLQTLGIPTYSVPKSSNLTSVIPSFIATTNVGDSSQTVTTPPLDKIVPGQHMLIPVQSSVIPSTGGLKQLDVKSNKASSAVGNAPNDWFVIHTTNALPSSKPALPKNDKLTLYINVTYAYEATGKGFNWGNSSNFATSPKITLQLPRNAAGITVDSQGCPVSDVFVYDPSHNSWTTNPVTILSSTPTSSSMCDVVVQTQHFSQFALGSTSTSSSSTQTTSTSTSNGGGTGVGVGVGAVGVGATSASSSGEGAGPYLKIEKISYDVCDKHIVRIQVATDSNETDPMVIVRTSIIGVVNAHLAENQPYAQENVNATIRKLVYEASIDPKETSFEVLALESIHHNIFSVGKTVEVTGCSNELDFTKVELPTQQPEIDLSAPKIFDLKFQVGNGTKQLAESTATFVDNKPLSVYAIVDTPTHITSSELRLEAIGDASGQYHSITMNVVSLPISNSTYLLSATATPDLLNAPAMKYWVHVENSANKKVDSDVATIGVKPNYPILAGIELDAKAARIEGTTGHPTAYFTNNSTGPVYGNIVLAVNGTVVYTSPSQVFNTGQTTVNLEWKTITVGKILNYQLQARAEIFGKKIVDPVPSHVVTLPGTTTVPLSHLSSVDDILQGNVTVARASVLYSSFVNDGTMRYKVVSPDGTCVIGSGENCLVSSSTIEKAGGIKTVTIGDQVYRVRYTGPDNSLERFSITSADSLKGNWKVEIDSTNSMVPVAQAMDNVILKVKYRAIDTPFITEKP